MYMALIRELYHNCYTMSDVFLGKVSCRGRMELAEPLRITEVWQEGSSDDGGNIAYARNQRLSTGCLFLITPSNTPQHPLLDISSRQCLPSYLSWNTGDATAFIISHRLSLRMVTRTPLPASLNLAPSGWHFRLLPFSLECFLASFG